MVRTDWQKIGNYVYYFGTNGVMVTGSQTIDGKNYKFNENTGRLLKTGWVTIGSDKYYLKSAVAQKGWVDISGTKYYFMKSTGVYVGKTIPSGYVRYGYLTDTTLQVVGYYNTKTDLKVLDSYDGNTVTQIGAGAFKDNTNLKSIDLPDTITVIGSQAFMNCTNLSSMN